MTNYTFDDTQLVYKRGTGFVVFVPNSKAAQLINQRLKKYPASCLVAEGSEGIFEFEASQLPFVRAVLKANGLATA